MQCGLPIPRKQGRSVQSLQYRLKPNCTLISSLKVMAFLKLKLPSRPSKLKVNRHNISRSIVCRLSQANLARLLALKREFNKKMIPYLKISKDSLNYKMTKPMSFRASGDMNKIILVKRRLGIAFSMTPVR